MLTITSIMASQENTTKIVFHFGVTNNFRAKIVLKMHALKEKINNLAEFNFLLFKGSSEKNEKFS